MQNPQPVPTTVTDNTDATRFSESEALSPEAVTPPTLLSDFSNLVASLAKPGQDIVDTLNADKAHLLHMTIGVCGEAGELLYALNEWMRTNVLHAENALEESGDILFYIEGMRESFGYTQEDMLAAMPQKQQLRDNVDALILGVQISYISADVLDQVKKHVIYNKDLDIARIGASLYSIEHLVASVLGGMGYTREDALQYNIAKLGKRYSTGTYSDQAAQDRADKVAGESENLVALSPQ